MPAISSIAPTARCSRRRLQELALLDDARFTWPELTVAALLLWAIGIAVYAAHVVNGGLYSDDFSLAALYRFAGTTNHLTDFINIDPSRPVGAVYLMLTFALLGTSATAQLAVSLLIGLIAATLFYAVLRTVGLVRLYAWLIAVLSLLFPYSDATKLWADANPVILAMAFCCAGLLLMLRAFSATGRRSLILHLLSLACYALSIMTYELAAPVIALSVPLLAVHRAPRQELIRRAAVDIVMTLFILKFVTSQTSKQSSFALGAMWAHGKAIANQGILIFGEALFPFYSVPEHRLPLAVALIIALGGIAVFRMLPRDDPDRALLGQALTLTWVGVAVTILGWVILLPANIVYSPAAPGDGTRINGAAGFGLPICIFGLLLTCGVLIFRGLTRSRWTAGIVACVAAATIGVGYAVRTSQDVHRWDATAATRSQVLAVIHRLIPHPATGTFVMATGFSQEPYDNIGTFDVPWDLNAAVQLMYGNPSLAAQSLVSSADLHCGAARLTPLIAIVQSPSAPVSYGPSVYLVNAATQTVRVIASRRACLSAGGAAA